MNRSYKNDLIQLNSYNNKNKIIYTVFVKDRSLLKGVRFIETDNKICVEYIPKNVKKKDKIENIKKIQKGDILIKINNIYIKSIEKLSKLVDGENYSLTFMNPKLYNKEFKLLNNMNDKKLIRQRYYKYQLNMELIEKNYYTTIIQRYCKQYLYKKREREHICKQIHDISVRYVNIQIVNGIRYYKNSLKLANLLRKLYYSKLLRDKQNLENEKEILSSINNLNKFNIENLKNENIEKDELLFNSKMRYRMKWKSLAFKHTKEKLELERIYFDELERQTKIIEKMKDNEKMDILNTGILIENIKKKFILKVNEDNIEIIDCKNNKVNKYIFEQIKYILAKNNDGIIIIGESFENEYKVESKYRNLIVNFFHTNKSN